MSEGKIKVLPSTVRIEKIDLLEFLGDLPEIIKSVPELSEIRATSVSLSHPRGSISMGYVSQGAFNLSCGDPEILDKLVEAMKKFYESKTK
jgi:hypothetical protein